MADISELILEVKNANSAVHEIDKVDKKLKQTTKSADELKTIGKTLFAGWSFTKLIGAAKSFGDAWRDTLITTRKFDAVFGSFNRNAQAGVKELTEKFHETERSARDLIATIGSRLDFGFDTGTLGKVSADLARISEELSSFYGKNVTDVSLKLTQALAGQTKGLKEYGINIDINGQKFKELAKNIQKSTHETEEGARALAVYTSILGKVRDKEGAFETQAKTLSQLLDDIKKSFVDGPLAQAGKILSSLLSPLFSVVNYILASPIISKIIGITTAIVTLTASLSSLGIVFKAIKFIAPKIFAFPTKILETLYSIPAIIGKLTLVILKYSYLLESKIAFWLASFFSKLSRTIGLYFAKIASENGKSWYIAAQSIIPMFKPYGALIGGALIAALSIAGNDVLTKLSPGYRKVKKQVINWLSDIFESLSNWAKKGKWMTNEELYQDKFKQWEEKIDYRKEIIQKYDDKIKNALSNLDHISKQVDFPDDLISSTEDFYKKFNDLRDEIPGIKAAKDMAEEAFKTAKDNLEKNKEEIKAKKDQYKKERGILAELYTEEELMYQKSSDMLLKNQKLFLEKANKVKEMYDEYMRIYPQMIKFLNSKFTNFSWYRDLIDKINDSVKESLPDQKVERLKEKIKKFKEVFSGKLLNVDDAEAKYKELASLEMQKFEAEMEALNVEKEFIQSTNDMIKKYVDEAMQWREQGAQGISANTAEGYKFMTSAFGNLSQLGPIVEGMRTDQNNLQAKNNEIASQSKNILEKINEKVSNLGTTGLVNFQIVN